MESPKSAWLCNERFWHIAGTHEFQNSTLFIRADAPELVALVDALRKADAWFRSQGIIKDDERMSEITAWGRR